MRILISAGEASGDLYASRLVEAIRARHPEAEFFGCAGPRMQAAGVRAVVDARSLAVVGIVEVVGHLPRIWGEFRKLIRAARAQQPDLAILTDSPDFHVRVAKRLRREKVPVVYLIAPQAWAWREGRVKTMRATVSRLLCIFPFEEEFFNKRGVLATYIGHPLASVVKPSLSREEFDARFGFAPSERLLALLPGSRHGEVARHLPVVIEAAEAIQREHSITPVLALPPGFGASLNTPGMRTIEGQTWDVLARCELALAASGTVTVEAALLGVPMVTFYRVNPLSWTLGRWLVKAPFLTMVNLVAGRRVVPELIQHEMTAGRIAAEAGGLLKDPDRIAAMRSGLADVAARLKTERDPMEIAAECVERLWECNTTK
ncbi:MAG: lipid-A-disaccharide synthase [Bryobacterales bacterium]|nr:lipid-A-disaccharide synthase [Bryobacterales bacterium]MBV9399891.1 lipid-A-disaccharide synthase [Bryobacterales bacterium]